MDKLKNRREYVRRIYLALQYIDLNITEDIQLDDIAKAAYFSPFHFHRIFTAFTGESPAEYLRRIRLEKASAKLITNPYVSITETAFECGFSSSSLFSRSFKEHFGVSPRTMQRLGFPNSKKSKIESKNSKEPRPGEWYIDNAEIKYRKGRQKMENLKDVKVEVRKLKGMKVAYVLHMKGYDDMEGICKAYEKLFAWAGPRGLIPKNNVTIGMSPDNPDITAKDKCRHYACIPLDKDVKPEGEVGIMDIEEGDYAIGRFSGGTEIFKKAYNYMCGTWLPDNGYQPDDRYAFEVYFESPDSKGKGKYVFDLCVPVKPLLSEHV